MFRTTNNENKNQDLLGLDLVPPSTKEVIYSAVMEGQEEMRESYLYRCAHSMAEFIASCELAETNGLKLYA